MLKQFDSFSGCGGFSKAFENEFETVGFSETDQYASANLKYNFPEIKNFGDVTTIEKLPKFDILTGGTPCQSLSTAGNREGLEGESGLFFDFVRLLQIGQPNSFVWENVGGALTSTKGWDFARVLMEFSRQGYACKWQILSPWQFGFPLQRDRVFIIGTKRRISRREVFSFTTDDKVSGETRRQTLPRLTATDYKGPSKQRSRIVTEEDGRIRRFTPLEHERLMGMPDGWTSKGIFRGKEREISDTQRYKMIGNSVHFGVVEKLLEIL